MATAISAIRICRRHARAEGASSTLLIGRAADAEVLLRGIESGAVKQLWPVGVLSPSAADRGQLIRSVPVLGGIDDVEDVIRDFAARGKPIAQLVMTPSAFEPEAHPEAVLMRAKRLGLFVSRLPSLESGDVPRLTNVAVRRKISCYVQTKNRLCAPRRPGEGQGGDSHGWWGLDRLGNLQSSHDLRRIAIACNREFGDCALHGDGGLRRRATGAVIEGRIADIRDRDRVMRLMIDFKPDIVFHAAALKHVPILERD